MNSIFPIARIVARCGSSTLVQLQKFSACSTIYSRINSKSLRQASFVDHDRKQIQKSFRRSFTNDVNERPDLNLTYEQFLDIIEKGDHKIFDVRSKAQVSQMGKITKTATNIPIGDFAAAFLMHPEHFRNKYGVDMPGKDDTDVVLYCSRGIQSMGGLAMLSVMGHKGARHYPGGYEGWMQHQNQHSDDASHL